VSETTTATPAIAVLKNRNFAIFWSAALLSNVGMWMSNLTIPFVLYQITGSAIWVGFFALANFVPSIILAPIGGVIADRFDRRKVLIVTQLGAAAAAASLWLVWLAGVREPVALLIPIVASGIFAGFNMASFMAFINDLVPRRQLRAAVTLNSIQFNIARAFGPLIAGVLLATAGPAWALFINFISYALVVLALTIIRAREKQQLVRSTEKVTRQLSNAVRYMWGHAGIRLALIGGFVGGVLGQPIYSMSVVLAHTVYNVDEFHYGLLNAALSAGAIMSIPLLAGGAKRFPLSRAVGWGLAGGAGGLIAIALIQDYWVALPVFVFTGASLILVMAGTNTVVQLIVRNDLRGRVMAVRQMSFMTAVPIGAMLGGITSDLVGVQPFLMACGVTMLLALIAMRSFPRQGLVSMDAPHDAALAAAADPAPAR
jgi:MFS family permease